MTIPRRCALPCTPKTAHSAPSNCRFEDDSRLGCAVALALTEFDGMMAGYLSASGSLRTTASLVPLPLLGVPGWWPDNGNVAFYENARYFRPAPNQTAAS